MGSERVLGAGIPTSKDAGYHGIDALPPDPRDLDRFQHLLNDYGFDYILHVLTTGDTVEEHVESFRQQVEAGKVLEPRLIGCHGGRDAWSGRQSKQFFEQVLQIEREAGIPVGHETHRGRILYHPWVASQMLDRFPDLKLVCDFSHWTCVSERLLHNETDIIRQCAGYCIHIHARVGYEGGRRFLIPARLSTSTVSIRSRVGGRSSGTPRKREGRR